jgi:hypothetical protein
MLTDEESKALKEMAKAAGTSVEAARDFGTFIARYIGGPLEQAIGIWHDKLKYHRWKNQIVLAEKAKSFLLARGIDGPTRTLDLSLAIPLLEEASLSDSEVLRDRWATLLANAADASRPEVRRAYISILAELTPFDTVVLEKITDADRAFVPALDKPRATLCTMGLPDSVSYEAIGNAAAFRIRPDVEVSLVNLGRLGLLDSVAAWGGMTNVLWVTMTELGRQFVAACRPSDAS